MTWPGGDHTAQARVAARRVDVMFTHGPAVRKWAAGLGLGASASRWSAPRSMAWRTPSVMAAASWSRPTLRQALAGLVRARGLQAVVRLPGWSSQPARYVAGASVHVVPSREESWSQSAVMALGLGVPVVGTAVDGLAHTLGDGRGVLVPPEDPPALAAALARVLAGVRPDAGPGRAYAQQFTPSAAAALYLDAYRRLLASRARSRHAGTAATPAASAQAATGTPA